MAGWTPLRGQLHGLVRSQGELWAVVEESNLNTGICMTLQSDLDTHNTHVVDQSSSARAVHLHNKANVVVHFLSGLRIESKI